MNSGNRSVVKEHLLYASDLEVMEQVLLHRVLVDAIEVAAGDHAGGQGLAVAIGEVVDQVGLSSQDDWQKRLGILFKLGESV